MTSKEEQSDAKPSTSRRRTSGSRQTSKTKADGQEAPVQADQPGASPEQSQPPAEASQSTQREGKPPTIGSVGGGQDFGQLLQQQIAQALQPVLANVRQEIKSGQAQRVTGSNALQATPETPANLGLQTGSEGQSSQKGQGQLAQLTGQQSAKDQSQPDAEEQADDTTSSVGGLRRLASSGVGSALNTGVHFVERQAEEWIVSALLAALSALLAESTHGAVQRRAEGTLHNLLQKSFDALPEGAVSKDLQSQTERTLQAVLRETVDALFAEGARSALEEHGAEASRNLVHRDFGGALQEIQHVLHALVQEFVSVLRRQWQRILRLLLRLVLTALQDSLAPEEKDSLTDLSTEPSGQNSG